MNRIKILLMAAVLLVTMVSISAVPATAQSETLVYLPNFGPTGVGGTFSCTDGPPFTSVYPSTANNPNPSGNCDFSQNGQPSGLVCNTPTTVTFPNGETLSGSICSSSGDQEPGQSHCGPWQTGWYVSSGGWWYGWSWRWCHNPSEQGDPYYVDWASWAWGGYAGPDVSPGYKYSVPAGPGPA